jgi:hypothetical protein
MEDFAESGNIGLLALQETWRSKDQWPLKMGRFNVFEAMATRSGPGERGLAMCVDKKWMAYEFGQASNFCVGVKVLIGNLEWSVLNIYIPMALAFFRLGLGLGFRVRVATFFVKLYLQMTPFKPFK